MSQQRNGRQGAALIRWALTAADEEVGPACAHVPVPATIAEDHSFREAYSQGYRHALADVRKLGLLPASPW